MISIAFTGQDGTGKSAQVDLLRRRLQTLGLRVLAVHQYEPVTALGSHLAPLLRRLANRRAPTTASAAERGPGRRRQGPAPGPLGPLIAAAYLAVGLVRSWWNYLTRRSCDVLILDRFFSDEVVRAVLKFGYGAGIGCWLLRHAAPRPTLIFSFTAAPETGWRRKKTREMNLGEYRRKVSIIRAVLGEMDDHHAMVMLPIDGLDIAAVAECVWREVRRYLPAADA